MFPGLGDKPDEVLEDDKAEDFERVVEKVSYIAWPANIEDEEPVLVPAAYASLAPTPIVNFSELIERLD